MMGMSHISTRLTDALDQCFGNLRAKQELMNRLADGEQLSPNEIAAILSTHELPVAFEAATDVRPEQ
jgi:DNA-directed RNA polymerase specialized sigma24 family protein